MRAIIQVVSQAKVEVENKISGQIKSGLLILLGVSKDDGEDDINYLAKKIANLRIFPDQQDKMNLSLLDINGAALVISQFTIFGDCRKGRRPSYGQSAPPQKAKELYEKFIELLVDLGIKTETGIFQAHMEVSLLNNGPITLIVDSKKVF